MTQLQATKVQPGGHLVSARLWMQAQAAVTVAVFVALLALAAQVRVHLPGTPVPVTLQTAVVLLCGFSLRPKAALAAVGLYLAIGFTMAAAGNGGLFFASFAIGRTGTLGYLIGFLLAAGLLSAVRCRMHTLTFGRTLALAMLGSLVIFLCGVMWQALAGGNLEVAVTQGLLPFIAADAVKVGLVTALVQAVRGFGYEPGV
jgi:biotin transport system substrate-specific component